MYISKDIDKYVYSNGKTTTCDSPDKVGPIKGNVALKALLPVRKLNRCSPRVFLGIRKYQRQRIVFTRIWVRVRVNYLNTFLI